MEKDYYKILEITDDEKNLPKDDFLKVLKKKYRNLCIKWHPDKNPGNKEAEEQFKLIAEAYETLSDYDGKKQQYDNPGMGGFDNMEDLFKHFTDGFGGGFGGFNPFGRQEDVQYKGGDISGTIHFTLEDAIYENEKTIRYNRNCTCSNCHGSGVDPHIGKRETCPTCNGRKFRSVNVAIGVTQMFTCERCGGMGTIIKNPCKSCNGTGNGTEQKEMTIKVPKGVSNGMSIKYNKQGHGGSHNGNPIEFGDLIVTFIEQPHNIFRRNGNNLSMTLNIDVFDAILGCTKEITSIRGKIHHINIHGGCQEGEKFTVMDEGMPIMGTPNNGHLDCIVHINIPRNLTDKQKELIQQIKNG